MQITLKDKRPNLNEDFSSWLKKNNTSCYNAIDFESEEWENFMDSYFGDYSQDDDDYEDWDYNETYKEYWERKNKENKIKSNKRGKRGKKNKKKKEEEVCNISDAELDSILGEEKEIYFYEDIEDEKSVHKFKTLRKFFEFLEDNDIEISDSEGGKFIREKIRHCCIDPMYLDVHNEKAIISDHSYGALMYEVSEDAALFRD